MREIMKNLQPIKLGNEIYYSITETLYYLEHCTMRVILENILIIPFYIFDNKRYEIYYKEFDIDKMSGIKSDENKKILIDYFYDVLISADIRNDVRSFTKSFDESCLYFAVY